jgi:glycosyltransferase involved in cell wall biosynthesis
MAREGIPRVGIVIPAHNAEAFLAETLDSVLAQSFGDWSAVVADDASTDGTRALIEAYAARDGRISLLALDANEGVVAVRNRLVEATAPTELVALLDHDDLWREDYLARSVELHDAAVAEGRRPGIVASNAHFLEPTGVSQDTVAERFGWVEPVTYRDMLHANYVFARVVFARAAFDDTEGFSAACAGADDYDLWLQMMEAGWEVVSTREPLTLYRWNQGGLSRKRSVMFASHVEAYRRVLERGAVDASEQRLVRRRMRHYRLLYTRQRLWEAVTRS